MFWIQVNAHNFYFPFVFGDETLIELKLVPTVVNPNNSWNHDQHNFVSPNEVRYSFHWGDFKSVEHREKLINSASYSKQANELCEIRWMY